MAVKRPTLDEKQNGLILNTVRENLWKEMVTRESQFSAQERWQQFPPASHPTVAFLCEAQGALREDLQGQTVDAAWGERRWGESALTTASVCFAVINHELP